MKYLITIIALLIAIGNASALSCPEQIIVGKASESFMIVSSEQAKMLTGIPEPLNRRVKALNIGSLLHVLGIKIVKALGSKTIKISCRLLGRNVIVPSIGRVSLQYGMSLKRGYLPN